MPAIAQLFPDAKVIACVRELPWVIDSIERMIQRNVFTPSSIFNYTAGGTVYTRANGVAGQNGMVGAPYDALKQACYGAQKDRLLLVQYETLTTDPAKTMHAIYAFLGEPAFEHDFDHIDYDVTEFDERAGTPGLHTVARHGQSPAARDVAAAGSVQAICQRRVLARSAEDSRRAAGRVRSLRA